MKEMKQILIFLLVGFSIGLAYFKVFEPKKFDKKLGLSPEKVIAISSLDERKQDDNQDIRNSRVNAVTKAIKKVFPSVVGINVTSVRYQRGNIYDFFRGNRYRQYQVSSVGSGFVISEDGYIVTNQHVISDASDITVSFPNGDKYQAKKIGADKQTDIALIKIIDTNEYFTPLDIGDSNDIIIGEWSIAIGNPFGLNDINSQPTVTLGIISGKDKDFGHIEGEEKVYYNMIQTDAAINSGNSGGPLVNASGEVIGMNTFIYTGGSGGKGNVGIAFAIPINDIMKTVQQLQSGDIDRDVDMGISGIYENSKRLAYEYSLPIDYGVLVMQFTRQSPAYSAGVRRGDIIVSVNGQSTKTIKDLREAIFYSGLKVGDNITLEVYRENEKKSFQFKLAKQR